MNYNKIYEKLIDRAKCRSKIEGEYYETHHILPKCLGGNDDKDNLIALTGREHFVAHLCLVKIYPGNHSLIMAAVMMHCSSSVQDRSHNRLYEWLRKQHSKTMSEVSSGANSSQYNTLWIFNETIKETKKIKISELDAYTSLGWQKGRVFDFNNIYQICSACGKQFKCAYKKKRCSDECRKSQIGTKTKFSGREDEFRKHYDQTRSMNKALKAMGLPGAMSYYYTWAKSIIHPVD